MLWFIIILLVIRCRFRCWVVLNSDFIDCWCMLLKISVVVVLLCSSFCRKILVIWLVWVWLLNWCLVGKV